MNNTVTLRVESPPDKQGKVTFWCEYTGRGIHDGELRRSQYHGVIAQHEKFWREKRGREVVIVPFVKTTKKKGKK